MNLKYDNLKFNLGNEFYEIAPISKTSFLVFCPKSCLIDPKTNIFVKTIHFSSKYVYYNNKNKTWECINCFLPLNQLIPELLTPKPTKHSIPLEFLKNASLNLALKKYCIYLKEYES